MITEIYAMPKTFMLGLASGSVEIPFDRWYHINLWHDPGTFIMTRDRIRTFIDHGMVAHRVLKVADIVPAFHRSYEFGQPGNVLFNNNHACEIINFIDKVNEDMKDGALVINCNAGISRSGAVAVFAGEYLGFDADDIRDDNPHIMPNPHILGILRNIAERIVEISEKTS